MALTPPNYRLVICLHSRLEVYLNPVRRILLKTGVGEPLRHALLQMAHMPPGKALLAGLNLDGFVPGEEALFAGIAHEINNPLGGMLNAISNYRRHGGADPHAVKTLALIERGLVQIRDTVSALLVEAKLESRALTPDDLEDVRTLIAADAQSRHLRLEWDDRIVEALPLPSAQIRQILLNLLLNAVQASPKGQILSCKLTVVEQCLSLSVSNAGTAIPERRQQHLFEPYFGEGEVHGLGLWVTYQLVQQLGGEIVVDSVPGHTRFNVSLPLEPPHAT